ncbi:MAG: hypothetical protein ACQESO_09790, partial [Bacillota bacterium]
NNTEGRFFCVVLLFFVAGRGDFPKDSLTYPYLAAYLICVLEVDRQGRGRLFNLTLSQNNLFMLCLFCSLDELSIGSNNRLIRGVYNKKV